METSRAERAGLLASSSSREDARDDAPTRETRGRGRGGLMAIASLSVVGALAVMSGRAVRGREDALTAMNALSRASAEPMVEEATRANEARMRRRMKRTPGAPAREENLGARGGGRRRGPVREGRVGRRGRDETRVETEAPKTTASSIGKGAWVSAVERATAAGGTPSSDGGESATIGRVDGRWIPSKVRVEDAESDVREAEEEAEASRNMAAAEDDDAEVWIENYADAVRRAKRRAFVRSRGVNPDVPGVKALPKLGATRDDCPAAYSKPRAGAAAALGQVNEKIPKGFAKFSEHATRIANLAEHVYILCTKCSLMIPNAWQGKASFVHGHKIDECLQTQNADHWHKASFSHAHALMDALKKGYGTVAIIEEDVLTRDLAEGNDGLQLLYKNMASLRQAMKQEPQWQTVRAGYRTMFIDRPWESRSKLGEGEACPRPCLCDRVNDFTCIMRAAGCDMRSSDFYLVRNESMQRIIDGIYKGFTVDCEAMGDVGNQIYLTPQLSFQSNLDININKQLNMSNQFVEKCAVS